MASSSSSSPPAASAAMRVLITGATGLLGRALVDIFTLTAPRVTPSSPSSYSNIWHITALGWSRLPAATAGATPAVAPPSSATTTTTSWERCDIRDAAQVRDVIHRVRPHVIIHSAAERRPDTVEKDPRGTEALNVDATQRIATIANEVGAWVLYISTDYVFDGTSPPYVPTSLPNPLNLYGKTKLAGEVATIAAQPTAGILRVPVLYGTIQDVNESAVTVIARGVTDTSRTSVQDNWALRFPTHVDDVADMCRQLAERRLVAPSVVYGVHHFSSNDEHTKYTMATLIAHLLNVTTSHLQPDSNPTPGASRPRDAHLSIADLPPLGVTPRFTPFVTGLYHALRPFFPSASLPTAAADTIGVTAVEQKKEAVVPVAAA